MNDEKIILITVCLIIVALIFLGVFMIVYRSIYLAKINRDPIKAFLPVAFEPIRTIINTETGQKLPWTEQLNILKEQDNYENG